MKKFLFLALGALFLLPSCEDNDKFEDDDTIIWDFVCNSFKIYVKDATTGANLLDPFEENNILDKDITVEYNGKSYEITINQEMVDYYSPKTRFNAPKPLDLRLEYFKGYFVWDEETCENIPQNEWHLEFGEFSPEGYHHDQTFTIKFEDGTTHEFEFECYIEWKSKKEPVVHAPVSLNGVQNPEGWSYTFYR